jgi:hypothetical protein
MIDGIDHVLAVIDTAPIFGKKLVQGAAVTKGDGYTQAIHHKQNCQQPTKTQKKLLP